MFPVEPFDVFMLRFARIYFSLSFVVLMTDVTNLWIRQSAIPPLMRSSQSQWKPQRGTRNALIERYFLISALSFHELARESMQEWLIFSPIGSLMLCVQRWRQ